MNRKKRYKILQSVYNGDNKRKLADEPLSCDDWQRAFYAFQNFKAALRAIVVDARMREANKLKT